MITLGINIGTTDAGVDLRDGGAAIAENGTVIAAIGEEIFQAVGRLGDSE